MTELPGTITIKSTKAILAKAIGRSERRTRERTESSG